MLHRLAICVFVITLSRTYGQFQLSFGTPTPQAPKGPLVYDPNCKDSLTNCWDFPESSCRAPYDQWATTNCANRCGKCLGPTTAAPPCVNNLSNCESYDKSICTNPDYKNWASKNCRLFCGSQFCSPTQLAQAAARTTTISPANCVDKVDCRLYGPNACDGLYKEWAKDNCPSHCGFCTPLPTAPPVCADKIPNCKQYDTDTCTNTMYRLWVEDNCKKFCGLCSGVSTINYNVPPSPPPPGKKRAAAHKRQFSASHHHHDKCWDAGGDPNCATAVPPVLQTTVLPSGDPTTTADFPGSDIRPNHKPPADWDSKPSTEAPTGSTTKSTTDKTPKPTDDKVRNSTKLPETPPTVTTMAASKVPSSTSGSGETTTTEPDSTTITSTVTITDVSTTTTDQPEKTFTAASTTQKGAIKTGPPPVGSSAETTGTPSVQTPPALSTSKQTSGTPPVQTPKQGTTNTSSPIVTGVPPTLAPVKTNSSSTPTPTTTSTTTPTTTPTTPTTTSEPCVDTIPNCKSYGLQNCNLTVYKPWYKSHCASFCNFCPDYTKCHNKLQNCKEFDDGNLCHLESYYGWASENCYLYCSFYPCTSTVVTTEVVTTQSTTTEKITDTTTPFNCSDTLSNCNYYNDENCVGIYTSWARRHCAKRCGYCDEPLPCVDTNDYCDKYPSSICTADQYRGWARENCRKFCNLCQKPTQNPVTSQTGSSGTPTAGPSGTPPTPAAPVKSADPSFVTVPPTTPTF